jgi:hypothetical protein
MLDAPATVAPVWLFAFLLSTPKHFLPFICREALEIQLRGLAATTCLCGTLCDELERLCFAFLCLSVLRKVISANLFDANIKRAKPPRRRLTKGLFASRIETLECFDEM